MFFDVLRTFIAPTGFIVAYLTNYSANYSLRNSDFVLPNLNTVPLANTYLTVC